MENNILTQSISGCLFYAVFMWKILTKICYSEHTKKSYVKETKVTKVTAFKIFNMFDLSVFTVSLQKLRIYLTDSLKQKACPSF